MSSKSTSAVPALDTLCRCLTELLVDSRDLEPQRGDPAAHATGHGKEVADLLRAFASKEEESWRPWAHFVPERYARNLVYRCAGFELLLLCWGEGHTSPIHDHSGQECWMAILEGEFDEVHYSEPEGPEGVPMGTGRVRRFQAGNVAYIHDDIALHLIRPTPGTRGVTLHLYADAIDACRVFDPATGRATQCEVGYHSVRGVPCADRSADAIRAEWAAR